MYSKFRSLGIVMCGTATLVASLSAAPAYADRKCSSEKKESPETKHESKAFGKGISAAIKASDACHRARNSGKADQAVDCGDLAADQADSGGGFAKARDKLTDVQERLDADPDVPPPTGMNSNFTSCPEPCRTATGVTEPLATWVEVGACFVCLIEETVRARSDAMQGNPAGPLEPTEQACSAAISKAYAKRVLTTIKSRTKCQLAQDKEGQCLLQPCDTADPGDKIAGATTKAEAIVDHACAAANLLLLDSCANTNLTDLKACLLAADNSTGSVAFTSSFLLEP